MNWVSKVNSKSLNEKFISAKPFPHIVLHNIFSKKIDKVASALLKEQFTEQNSDLFQFEQTVDIKKTKNPVLKDFHRFFSSKEFISLISKITGRKLESIDMSGFVYDDTDYLLPHDDRLEGRKIAYVLQLGDNFSKNDGGALQFFKGKAVAKSISPKFNTLILFEVSPKSLHQVEEIKSKKRRVSLAGWFHA